MKIPNIKLLLKVKESYSNEWFNIINIFGSYGKEEIITQSDIVA